MLLWNNIILQTRSWQSKLDKHYCETWLNMYKHNWSWSTGLQAKSGIRRDQVGSFQSEAASLNHGHYALFYKNAILISEWAGKSVVTTDKMEFEREKGLQDQTSLQK